MDYGVVIKVLGILLVFEGLLMIPALFVSFFMARGIALLFAFYSLNSYNWTFYVQG